MAYATRLFSWLLLWASLNRYATTQTPRILAAASAPLNPVLEKKSDMHYQVFKQNLRIIIEQCKELERLRRGSSEGTDLIITATDGTKDAGGLLLNIWKETRGEQEI